MVRLPPEVVPLGEKHRSLVLGGREGCTWEVSGRDRERKFLSGFALGKFSLCCSQFWFSRPPSVVALVSLTGSGIFAMQRPMFLKMKCKRDWRPCQWKAETPVAGPFIGRRECDMSEQGIMEARANVVELFEELLTFEQTLIKGLNRAREMRLKERERWRGYYHDLSQAQPDLYPGIGNSLL